MTFVFYLRDRNVEMVKSEALSVSHPGSPKYGAHLTSAALMQLTAPNQHDRLTVTGWLASRSVAYSLDGDRRIRVETPIAVAEELLQTKFFTLVNPGHNQSVVRASSFELPAEVDAVVAAVFGLHGLPLPPRKALRSTSIAKVTPAVLAKTYSVGGVVPAGSDSVRQAVAEFQGQFMKPTDLTAFFKEFVPGSKAGDDQVFKFVGDKNHNEGTDEASLDIQYIMSQNPGLKTECTSLLARSIMRRLGVGLRPANRDCPCVWTNANGML
jgi:hypothetical protein